MVIYSLEWCQSFVTVTLWTAIPDSKAFFYFRWSLGKYFSADSEAYCHDYVEDDGKKTGVCLKGVTCQKTLGEVTVFYLSCSARLNCQQLHCRLCHHSARCQSSELLGSHGRSNSLVPVRLYSLPHKWRLQSMVISSHEDESSLCARHLRNV